MRERNILGSSKGYIDRIVASYSSVTLENAGKYFLSTLKFFRLYSVHGRGERLHSEQEDPGDEEEEEVQQGCCGVDH